MKLEFTQRGFARGEFEDGYGQRCMLQKSSSAETDAVWLGAFEKGPHLSELGAMHLDRPMVAALLPYLYAFMETGDMMRVAAVSIEAAHAFEAREALSGALAQAAANLEEEGWPHLAEALRELADPTPKADPEPSAIGGQDA